MNQFSDLIVIGLIVVMVLLNVHFSRERSETFTSLIKHSMTFLIREALIPQCIINGLCFVNVPQNNLARE